MPAGRMSVGLKTPNTPGSREPPDSRSSTAFTLPTEASTRRRVSNSSPTVTASARRALDQIRRKRNAQTPRQDSAPIAQTIDNRVKTTLFPRSALENGTKNFADAANHTQYRMRA